MLALRSSPLGAHRNTSFTSKGGRANRVVVRAPHSKLICRAVLTLPRNGAISRHWENAWRSVLATPATNVLAAGTAATAVHSILHTRADFFLEIAEKLSTKPVEMGMDSWLTGLALSSALQFAISAGISCFAREVLTGEDARPSPALRRAAGALEALPIDNGLVCRFAAKAVFFVAAQAFIMHGSSPDAFAAAIHPFQGLPDMIPNVAEASAFVQADDILSSTLQGLAQGMSGLCRATSVVLDRAASTSLQRAMTAALDTAASGAI
ncbi:hypothetical protein ACKKBG_A27160 [Auxenochlorella protothecoides x Auxenochlorella symbiontica]